MTTKTKKRSMVLVIEDERPLLGVIRDKLQNKDLEVITSRSVERAFSVEIEENAGKYISLSSVEFALKHIENLEKVGAIWLDHELLGSENGIDFVRKFKANGGHWKDIPIFVVSNTSDPELVKQYAELDVTRYYVKAEYTLEEIAEDIRKVLKGRSKTP